MNLSALEIERFARGVQKLAKDGPVNTYYGICHNLSYEAGDLLGYDLVRFACESWEGRNGDTTYPIPITYTEGARDPLWEGKQLEQRMSLLAHLAKYLEDLAAEPGDSRPDNA